MAGAFDGGAFDSGAFDSGGNAVSRTATDAPTTSESITRSGGFARAVTDAPTTSESETRLFVGSRAITDHPVTSESAAQTTAILRAATDAPTVSETLTRLFVGSRTTTDAPHTSDSATQSGPNARSATDAPTVSEVLGRTLLAHRTTSEAVSFSLSASGALLRSKSFTLDADIEPLAFLRHPRTGPHTGVDRDANHTLAHTFDRYVRGESLQEWLYDFDCRLTTMEQSGRHATCRRVRLPLDAVIRRLGMAAALTFDAHLVIGHTANLTLDAYLRGVIRMDAVIAALAYFDDFNRSVASGLGTNRGHTYVADATLVGTQSVNGSEALSSGAGAQSSFTLPLIDRGYIKFDYWVPSSTSDTNPYYNVDGWYAGQFVFLLPNGDGTWTASTNLASYTFTPVASTWYTVKAQIGLNAGEVERVKTWKRADPEPDWQDTQTIVTGYSLPNDSPSITGWGLSIWGTTSGADSGKVDNLYLWTEHALHHNEPLTLDAVIV